MPKKVNLEKEAAASAKAIKNEPKITDAMLMEYCPSKFLAEFKKAKTQAQRVDLLFKVDKERLAQNKVAAAMEGFTSKLSQWFIQELPEKDATGIAGKTARVQVVQKERPNVVDWAAFYAYIKKNSAFELLNRAVNAKSVAERWEANKKIPGLEKFKYKKVSLTKVK